MKDTESKNSIEYKTDKIQKNKKMTKVKTTKIKN